MSKKLIGTMTDEVAVLMKERGMAFHHAFAEVAHRHGIWHHENKERYNFHLRGMWKRIKKRNIKFIPHRAPTKQLSLPVVEFKKLAANDRD